MNWTTPADIQHKVHKLWERQTLLAALVTGATLFPLRLGLKVPSSTELVDDFSSVRLWIDDLKRKDGKSYRIVWREINHRVVGRHSIPKEVWIESMDDALALISKRAEVDVFTSILQEIRQRYPALLPWVKRYPFRVLECVDDWSLLLNIIDWMSTHPRPDVYLRQIDIPGIHTKFIEGYRGLLTELLNLTLSPESILAEATGVANFCRRYGFRDKPLRVRFRILDPRHAVFSPSTDQDITVNHDTFSSLDLPVRRIFITENEVNFLAFPPLEDSAVIFGAGYGFEMLAQTAWLKKRDIYYWGDIDTHGFAILDQLRAQLPHVQSFLMDRETLLTHRHHWVTEPTPQTRPLPRLNEEENALYDDLRLNYLGERVRLEQERVAFTWLQSLIASWKT